MDEGLGSSTHFELDIIKAISAADMRVVQYTQIESIRRRQPSNRSTGSRFAVTII